MAKVIITMPNEFLKKVDQEARVEHRSRSEFIREALRHYIASQHTIVDEEQSKRIKEAIKQIDEARKHSMGSKVKGSEIIQKWRYRLE